VITGSASRFKPNASPQPGRSFGIGYPLGGFPNTRRSCLRLLGLSLIFPLGAVFSSDAALAATGDAAGRNSLAACRAISSDDARLACYDHIPVDASAPAESAHVDEHDATAKAGLPVQPAPPPAVAGAPAMQAPTPPDMSKSAVAAPASNNSAAPEQKFGASSLALSRPPEEPNTLDSFAVGEVDGLHRGSRIRLDNGQTWVSIDSNDYDFEASHPAVTIARNFMGNYWLHFAGAHFSMRVERVE